MTFDFKMQESIYTKLQSNQSCSLQIYIIYSLTLTLQDLPKNTLFTALRRPRVVPKLQNLTLDFNSMGAADRERKEIISPKIQDIARSRQKGSVPLQWFSWKWGITEEIVIQKTVCPQCYGGQHG